jgi:hypothetical protein
MDLWCQNQSHRLEYRHTCAAARPQSHLQKLTTLNLRANEDRANNDREIHIGSAEHERSVDPEDLLPADLNVDLAIRILRLLATWESDVTHETDGHIERRLR